MNLSEFRKDVDKAVYKCDPTITLTIGEARQIILEAEKMAGGRNDSQNSKDYIESLKAKIVALKASVAKLSEETPVVDKVGALLPGGK